MLLACALGAAFRVCAKIPRLLWTNLTGFCLMAQVCLSAHASEPVRTKVQQSTPAPLPHYSDTYTNPMHILSLAAPDLRGFFWQWRQWQRSGALRDGAVLHYVWQCQQAPVWADVAAQLAAFANNAAAQGDSGITHWQQQAHNSLQAQWWGLLPGWHRLALADEQLILTLAIGDVLPILRDASGRFGQIHLHPACFNAIAAPEANPSANSSGNHPLHNLANALRPLCQQGTELHCLLPQACTQAPDKAPTNSHPNPSASNVAPHAALACTPELFTKYLHQTGWSFTPANHTPLCTAENHTAPNFAAPSCNPSTTAPVNTACAANPYLLCHASAATHYLSARYAPHWQATPQEPTPEAEPVPAPTPVPTCTQASATAQHAIVIGSGLAGAAAAYSLARRGWQVTVLEAGAQPAAGASALSVGLVAPHTSADDTRISQLSRSGIRCTLQRAASLLQAGQDWAASGVLEHCVQGQSKLPRHWPQSSTTSGANTNSSSANTPASAPSPHPYAAAADWSALATPAQCQAAQLPAHAVALLHPRAAWLKPPALIHALLRHPRIHFAGAQHVTAIHAPASNANLSSNWQVCDAAGNTLAQAPLLVIAAGYGSHALLQSAASSLQQGKPTTAAPDAATPPFGIALDPLRGQIAWGGHGSTTTNTTPNPADQLPSIPINGKGSMAAHIPHSQDARNGSIWIAGSTFSRGDTDARARYSDLPAILDKLQTLHPATAQALQPAFASASTAGSSEHIHIWAGIRVTLPDRMPAVGSVSSNHHAATKQAETGSATPHGLHLCCGMGARGLALAMLSGELLAAHIHHEPLPTGKKLAAMLAASRWAQRN